MKTQLLCGILLSATLLGSAFALSPSERLANPEQETRARELSTQFRCLVCQNQSVEDSDAELARDVRTVIREQIVQGKTDAQIREFLVSRYGEFVLLKPVRDAGTIALWATPAIILTLGALGAFFFFRRMKKTAAYEDGEL